MEIITPFHLIQASPKREVVIGMRLKAVYCYCFMYALAAALVEYERYAVWSSQDNHGDTQGLELEFSHQPRT